MYSRCSGFTVPRFDMRMTSTVLQNIIFVSLPKIAKTSLTATCKLVSSGNFPEKSRYKNSNINE